MSGSVGLSLLWLCLFAVHACNACRFGPSGGRNPSNPIHRLRKDIEIRNLRYGKEDSSEIVTTSIRHEELKDLMGHLRKQQVIGEVNSAVALLWHMPMKKHENHDGLRQTAPGQEGSAAQPFKSYQHNADAEPEASSISKARLMMESANSDHSDEAINSGELDDDVKGDGVVMDYAQPHRKPPIHNEKP